MPQLLIRKGSSFRKEFTFSRRDYVLIGRAQTNDIVLPDATRKVSRYHTAAIRVNGEKDAYFIRDLGSLHSTRVRGIAVDYKLLEDGDVIEVGDYELTYSLDLSPPSQAGGCLRLVTKKTALVSLDGSTVGISMREVPEFSEFTGDTKEIWDQLQRATGRRLSLPQLCLDVMPPLVRAVKAERGFVRLFQAGGLDTHHDIAAIGLSQGEQVEISDEAYLLNLLRGMCVQDRTTILAPLLLQAKLEGFICVDRTSSQAPFSPEEVSFICTVANLLSARSAGTDAVGAGTDFSGEPPEWPTQLVGASKKLQDLFQEIDLVASFGLNTLIQGETGTGKELVARAIHEKSARAQGPFIARNCGQITETLAESEIFGYAPKAGIADANPQGVPGWFELADHGTLFLDEIHQLTTLMQDKLLRVLQDKEVWRIGAKSPLRVDTQVLAATDEDMQKAVKSGAVRGPFYYRFAKRVNLPPLRERKEDIPLLAAYFMDTCAREVGAKARNCSHRAMQALVAYDWPGNVRELENCVKLAAARGGSVIFAADLPEEIGRGGAAEAGAGAAADSGMAFSREFSITGKRPKTIEETEKEKIMEALEHTHGNITTAGELLGYKSRQTMLNKIDRYGIPRNFGDLSAI